MHLKLFIVIISAITMIDANRLNQLFLKLHFIGIVAAEQMKFYQNFKFKFMDINTINAVLVKSMDFKVVKMNFLLVYLVYVNHQ